MTFNSRNIIHDIRQELDRLIDFVSGEQAQTATADHIERMLFREVLKLGAKLLLLFFVIRSQEYSRESIQLEDGQELPYHSEKKRDHLSIFGKIPFWRPYFYEKGLQGQSPLDAELSLGADRYSDFLREMMEYLSVYVAYSKAAEIVDRFLVSSPIKSYRLNSSKVSKSRTAP